jgi:hypothetical protein
MTPETVISPEPEPARMSEFSRISGVLFEPGKAFEDIGRRPTWFVPMLLTILSAVSFYIAYGQRVGFDKFLQQQLETNTRMQQQMAQVPAEKRDQQLAMQAKITGFAYYGATFIMTPIVFIISAALTLAFSAMVSAGLRFKQVFAIICFASVVQVIKWLLAIVVLFLKNPNEFDLTNPLAFNIGAFMDPNTSAKFLRTAAIALDVFAIWGIVLVAIGLKAAAGKRLSYGGAFFAAAAPTVLFVLLGASIAAAFG